LVSSSRFSILAQDKGKDTPAKDTPAKDTPAKDAKDASAKDAKDASAKDAGKDGKGKDAKDAGAKDAKDAKDAGAKDASAKDGKDAGAKDGKKTEDPKKGQEQPAKGTLEFKAFDPKGKPFFQEQTTTTKQKMKVMGQEVIQDQTQTFMIMWTPKEMKDKNYVVEQQIVGIDMKIDIGGNKIAYDSKVKNPKNPMTDFFDQLMKQKLTFTISPDLKVEKIEGRDEFIKGLSDINPQMQSLLKAILSEKALAKMAEPAWYAFPEKGVIPGSGAWTKTSDLDLGPIGKYNTTFDFKLEGNEGGKDKIGIKTKLTYTAPTDKTGLPFIIHEAKLTTDSGTGTATFDRAKGRFDSTEINMKLAGTLKIEVGSMNTTVELEQSQTAKSVTRDDNPWGSAEKK